MSRIASSHNPRLKALRRLHTRRERDRSGTFIAEGEDLVLAAADAGRSALEGYVVLVAERSDPAAARGGDGDVHAPRYEPNEPSFGESRAPDAGALAAATEGFHEVEAAALARVSALASGTRVLAVYEQRWAQAPLGPLCVYLHGVGDPGNVGTIVRAAHAFGASCVALGPGCADPYSPKAVRASMGAIFSVALARVSEHELDQLPGERVALAADAAQPLRGPATEIAPELTLLVGAEREGLPPELRERCEHSARIAIVGDSLNAAMAATVALYEMTREPSRVRP